MNVPYGPIGRKLWRCLTLVMAEKARVISYHCLCTTDYYFNNSHLYLQIETALKTNTCCSIWLFQPSFWQTILPPVTAHTQNTIYTYMTILFKWRRHLSRPVNTWPFVIICVYILIYLFIHLSRFFFYYCALCVLSLMELFYVYFIVYDHVHAFVGD